MNIFSNWDLPLILGSFVSYLYLKLNSCLLMQDFIVHNIRRTLFETISSFNGNVEDEKDMGRLIETQFTALREAFRVPVELGEEAQNKVAAKLLNLYRTGRLGHYTIDPIPCHTQ